MRSMKNLNKLTFVFYKNISSTYLYCISEQKKRNVKKSTELLNPQIKSLIDQ